MKITLTRAVGGHDKGDTLTVLDTVGARLIERSIATEVKARGGRKPKADETTTTADQPDPTA